MSARSSLSQKIQRLLIVDIRPWRQGCDAAARRRRHAVVGFEYRPAVVRELRCILPQTSDDSTGVRDLLAAKTPDIGRASHLLFPGSAVFFRGSRTMNGNAAANR